VTDIRANFYFGGAGLMEIGMERAGVKVAGSYELDPVRCATQRLNGRKDCQPCDVTKKLVLEDPECDAMVFTYPCDRYSTFGQITETRTGDDLYLHALRHKYVARPDAWVAENVPGMKKFPLVMEAMCRNRSYHVSVVEIDAKLWGLQRRKRVIIFGTARPFTPRLPGTVTRRHVREIVESNPEVSIPNYFHTRVAGGKYRDKPIVTDPVQADAIAPTCVAHYGKDRSTRCVYDRDRGEGVAGLRPWTVREYARLQGVPDSYQFAGTNAEQYDQIGDGVDVNVAEWAGSELLRYFQS
jgi:DNA (cytosine-5)-methyltransferase 1